MPRRTWLWLALVVAVGLVVRLSVLRFLPTPVLVEDSLNYDQMAKHLIHDGYLGYGGSEPNAYVMPGYPLFVAALYLVAGDHGPALVRVVQSVLGALSIAPFFLLARRALGTRPAVVVGLVLACYMTWVQAPAYLLTEVLFTFCFGWYLWVQVVALERWRQWRWPMAAGILLGLSVLVRPMVAPLVLMPWVYLMWAERNWRVWRPFLWSAAGFSLLLLPWWIRNMVSLHEVTFLASESRQALLEGMTYMWQDQAWSPPSELLQHPLALFGWLLIHKPVITVAWYTYYRVIYLFGWPWLRDPLQYVLHEPIIVLGWFGAFAYLGKRHALQPLSLLVCFLVCLHLPFVVDVRYAYPMIGVLVILAVQSARLILARGEGARE